MLHNTDFTIKATSNKYWKDVYFINTSEMLWSDACVFAQTEGLPPSREGRAARVRGDAQRCPHLTHFFLFAEMFPEVGHHKGPIGIF